MGDVLIEQPEEPLEMLGEAVMGQEQMIELGRVKLQEEPCEGEEPSVTMGSPAPPVEDEE